jgi:ubiquinone/menaquinone biosynthesis C-methylase UbiE
MQVHAEISNAVLRRLHAGAVTDADAVRDHLSKACVSRLLLQGRRTIKGEAERAWIRSVEPEHLVIKTMSLSQPAGSRVLLSFAMDGRTYSFSALALDDLTQPVARVAIPSLLYIAERRDRYRRIQSDHGAHGVSVRIRGIDSAWSTEAVVEDYSPVGLNVRLRPGVSAQPGEIVEVCFSGGELAGATRWGQIKHMADSCDDWTRAGLAISEARHAPPLEVERRMRITEASALRRFRNGLSVLSAGAASASGRMLARRPQRACSEAIELVEFENSRGEQLRGIIDRTEWDGPMTGVVIPPAWGRTKETLLPLALTIVETFKKAGEKVAVLRFDGTRRRGESYKEPGFEDPDTEHLAFRLSHAIDDISAACRFMTSSSLFDCAKVVLVTFSAASIEGRRAVLLDEERTVAGWVSVVGSPDFQSGLRAVSGGVDYVGGAERGLMFGVQEIMGVAVDTDAILEDAISHRLPFLEDARRDMEAIRVPVTWIHGAHDGWLDIDRVREIMGCGSREKRRLLEVPTGHQLRSSLEALEVFQLVAVETVSMATGRAVAGALPNLRALDAKRAAERARLPKVNVRVKDLWRRYLIGREGHLGIELMNASRAYQELMDAQIEGLSLRSGDRIADVGSGTGSFPLALARREGVPEAIRIDEIDFVAEAHERARVRLGDAMCKLGIKFELCDLENPMDRRRVFSAAKYDAVLLSLLLGYVANPVEILKDIRRSLRKGGRLVLSTMRKDTDASSIFFEALDELRAGPIREEFGEEAERNLDASARQFLNEAARILDLEEAGVFRFFDSEEVVSLLTEAGFKATAGIRSFGNPPQALIFVAEPLT